MAKRWMPKILHLAKILLKAAFLSHRLHPGASYIEIRSQQSEMSEGKTKITRVVVTGGAPFKQWHKNPSSMIKDALPDQLVVNNDHIIQVFKYTENVVCEYDHVLHLMPKVWSGQRHLYKPHRDPQEPPIQVDLVLHIGMNPDYDGFALETRARRDGYEQPGQDGRPLPTSTLKGLPSELHPAFDLDGVLKRVEQRVPSSIPVRLSDDAGLYFCEFQLFLSLAHLYEKKESQRAEFLHVPKETDKPAIARGVKVACALLIELVTDMQHKDSAD